MQFSNSNWSFLSSEKIFLSLFLVSVNSTFSFSLDVFERKKMASTSTLFCSPARVVLPSRTRCRRRLRLLRLLSAAASEDDDDNTNNNNNNNNNKSELSSLDKLLLGKSSNEEEATTTTTTTTTAATTTSNDTATKPPVFREITVTTSNDTSTKPPVFREITVKLDEETAADLSVRVQSASSRVVQNTQYPPLGIVLEPTREGVKITEVTDASSPFKENDIVRAVSGMIPTMKFSQGNLLLGGNGRPGFNRVMCTVRSALEIKEEEIEENEERLLQSIDMEFETCLKAIQSNGKAGDYEVVLVVERRASAE